MLPDMESLGIQDRNHDGIADYLDVRIYVADDANASEIAAAANIAARLAFETTSMDLPIGFPASAFERGHGRSIFVGSAANIADEAGSILLPDVAEAEKFALAIGVDDYTPSARKDQSSLSISRVGLSSILQSVQRIILTPDVCSPAVIDLAARVSLESTTLRLPLVVVADGTQHPTVQNSILIGASYEDGILLQPEIPGQGRIFVTGSNVVIAGSDAAGEAAALRYASLQMPYTLSFASIEDQVRRYTPFSRPKTEVVFDTETNLAWEVDEALQKFSWLSCLRLGKETSSISSCV
jgi:hypothetical protein